MIIKTSGDIPSSEITPKDTYLNRRKFMQAGAAIAATPLLSSMAQANTRLVYQPVDKAANNGFYTKDTLTPYASASSYNNFYEFGTGKADPAKYAHSLTTEPWTVEVSGECAKPGKYALEDILAEQAVEERIYRLRCVEAWSMVIPWVGFSLADWLKQMQPTSDAKYVSFETLQRPKEMRGQRGFASTIDWPYVEGLRMDEAMHPLSFIATGMYGEALPNQNGAPLRLVVPWKYGFKSIKSIVKVHFSKRKPKTTWNELAANEYGFYANVNPKVDHPRWSQATERRLPSSLWSPNRIDTKMFNGYADQVTSLYAGMNLKRYY